MKTIELSAQKPTSKNYKKYSVIVDDADYEEEVFNDITTIPLIGKIYTATKWATGLSIASRGATNAAYKPFQVIGDYGLIDVGSSETPNQSQLLLQKPPPAWFFSSTKGANVRIDPGEIKKSYVKFKATMSLNNFLIKCPTIMGSSEISIQIVPFGKCEVIGLEKMLDSRDETSSKISLGYELNQVYKVACRMKNTNRSIPIIEVETEPYDNKYPA